MDEIAAVGTTSLAKTGRECPYPKFPAKRVQTRNDMGLVLSVLIVVFLTKKRGSLRLCVFASLREINSAWAEAHPTDAARGYARPPAG